MKHIALITLILVVSAPVFAQTYSNSNLSGTYSLQFSTPVTYTWSKTFTCPTNSSITYAVSVTQAGNDVVSGSSTFDGNGNASFTLTEIGQENQSASANTTSVSWNSSCQVVSINDGHVVYKSATTKTSSGTYSIQSNGTGTMIETGSSQSQTVLLAATSNGLSTTVLISNPLINGKNSGTGIAVHQ